MIEEEPRGVSFHLSGGGPEPRLLTRIWVQAQTRLCDRYFIQMVVARRGDPDAGAVVVRLLRAAGSSLLLRRQTKLDGASEWVAVPGGGEIDNQTADAYLAREIDRDRDLWVLEVDDPKGRYWPDAPIDS